MSKRRHNLYYIKKWRAREELKLKLLVQIVEFKSTEEPRIKLSDTDKNIVLTEILSQRLYDQILS